MATWKSEFQKCKTIQYNTNLRLLRGSSSNLNESIHSSLWSRANKGGHCGRKRLELAVALTTLKWNAGYRGILGAMQEVGLEIGEQLVSYFDKLDEARMAQAEQRRGLEYYRKRKERKESQKKRDAELKKLGVVSYQSGGF